MQGSQILTSLLLFLLLAIPVQAETILLFDVTSQRSYSPLGASTTIMPGGAFNFQWQVSLADGPYEYTGIQPPE